MAEEAVGGGHGDDDAIGLAVAHVVVHGGRAGVGVEEVMRSQETSVTRATESTALCPMRIGCPTFSVASLRQSPRACAWTLPLLRAAVSSSIVVRRWWWFRS